MSTGSRLPTFSALSPGAVFTYRSAVFRLVFHKTNLAGCSLILQPVVCRLQQAITAENLREPRKPSQSYWQDFYLNKELFSKESGSVLLTSEHLDIREKKYFQDNSTSKMCKIVNQESTLKERTDVNIVVSSPI